MTTLVYLKSAEANELASASGRVEGRESQIQINPIQTPKGRDLCLPLVPPRLRLRLLMERSPVLSRLKSDPKPILLLDRF